MSTENHRFPEDPTNGWIENRKYVLTALSELKRDIKDGFEDVNLKIEKLSFDLITLKIKAGLWGGLIGAALTLLGSVLVDKIFKSN